MPLFIIILFFNLELWNVSLKYKNRKQRLGILNVPANSTPQTPGCYKVDFLVFGSVQKHFLEFYKTSLKYSSRLFTTSHLIFCPFVPFKVNSVSLNGSDFHLLLNISITALELLFRSKWNRKTWPGIPKPSKK